MNIENASALKADRDATFLTSLHTYTVGMPHLAFGGLSENWALKECGHYHWILLSKQSGLQVPDFRDEGGNRLYPAFTAVRVVDAHLEYIREHDPIEISSSLEQISRTQHRSTHILTSGGRCVARIQMLSAFLRRLVPGSNHLLERAVVRGSPKAGQIPIGHEDHFSALARALRTGKDGWELLGFRWNERKVSAQFTIKPCPHNDFNGADFLYFASFQALTDRAEWEWHSSSMIPRTQTRELFYHGNINVGDVLNVRRCSFRVENDGFAHWCEFVRSSDEKRVADVFTVRRLRA